MNTQEKINVLQEFIKCIDKKTQKKQEQQDKRKNNLSIDEMRMKKLPSIEITKELIAFHKQINKNVTSIYSNVENILEQLNTLQNQKTNVNRMLDSMTAIRQIRRISYGLGLNASQVYKNLCVYYSVKDKIYYCDKYIDKIEENISIVKQDYKKQLDNELMSTNSQSISDLVKVLNLIQQNSSDGSANANDQLSQFYVNLLRKEYEGIFDDLFKIPIVGNITDPSFIFFDLAKNAMKGIVSLTKIYRGNIVKIGGQESLESVIIQMFKHMMEGIIFQILQRQQKYFQVDGIPISKIGKDMKMEYYLRQFCSIWNQVQQLKFHMLGQSTRNSIEFENRLQDATNTSSLLNINSQVIKYMQALSRSKFDKLLKREPFVTGLWKMDDPELIKKALKEFEKGDREGVESEQSHSFLVNSFEIFAKGVEMGIETLNILIISALISYTNHHLLQEDFFHAINELFERCFGRLPSSDNRNYAALVLVINCLCSMPISVKNTFSSIQIPPQLENSQDRLKSQIKELIESAEYRTKEVLHDYINTIVKANFTLKEIKKDYKSYIDKWVGFKPEVNQQLLSKLSSLQAQLIVDEHFRKEKKYNQIETIALQKQIRAVISYYENKGSSVLHNFKQPLRYVEILMAESEQDAQELIKRFQISEEAQKQRMFKIRELKLK